LPAVRFNGWPGYRERLELAPRYHERAIPRIAFTTQ
jgi:hypothetical protein